MNIPQKNEISIFIKKSISNKQENFSQVKKSLIRCHKTGATLVNLEFYKKFDNNTVKLVKLKINKYKILELKTLFIMN